MHKEKQVAACGLDCGVCEHRTVRCDGCRAVEGKPFWSEELSLARCEIFACTRERGRESCKDCDKVPCSIWQRTREPDVDDAAFAQQIKTRLANLGTGQGR